MQSYLLSIASVEKKEEAESPPLYKEKLSHHCFGIHSSLRMSTWCTHFNQGIKFQLSLFRAF